MRNNFGNSSFWGVAVLGKQFQQGRKEFQGRIPGGKLRKEIREAWKQRFWEGARLFAGGREFNFGAAKHHYFNSSVLGREN